MDAATLKEKIQQGESIILLDVRDAEEIQKAPFFTEAPKNYLNIPILPLLFASKAELEEKIFGVIGVPTTTLIVTLCRSGGRSERACIQLRNHGWQAESLDGGIVAWGEAI